MTTPATRATEIRQRLEAATEGPWWEQQYEWLYDDGSLDDNEYAITAGPQWEDFYIAARTRYPENIPLIANAPADLRFLLDRVDDLEEAIRAFLTTYPHAMDALASLGYAVAKLQVSHPAIDTHAEEE